MIKITLYNFLIALEEDYGFEIVEFLKFKLLRLSLLNSSPTTEISLEQVIDTIPENRIAGGLFGTFNWRSAELTYLNDYGTASPINFVEINKRWHRVYKSYVNNHPRRSIPVENLPIPKVKFTYNNSKIVEFRKKYPLLK